MRFFKTQRSILILLIFISIFLILLNTTFYILYTMDYFKNYEHKLHMWYRMDERRTALKPYLEKKRRMTNIVKHVLRKMFIDTQHKISWCPIYKAASTVWMKGFAELGGLVDDHVKKLVEKGIVNWNTVARKAFPIDQDTNATFAKFNSTYKFLVVRHPLERILAVYRDKFEQHPDKDLNRKYNIKQDPTFVEFIKFILNNNATDEQWTPMNVQCLPHVFKYDYIIKTETFNADNIFMLDDLGLDHNISNYPPENVNKEGETNLTLAKIYYSNVPYELLHELCLYYRDDFFMFGYHRDDYNLIPKY